MGGTQLIRTVALLTAVLAVAACGTEVSATGPMAAGAPATGGLTTDRARQLRVYFRTPYGSWPDARPARPGAGPQQALDALLAGPTAAERARGLTTALPGGSRQVRARAVRGAVELYLPWVVSELDHTAVSQLVCTAAGAPGVPGGRAQADVVVRVFESGIAGQAWPVTCDETGSAVPLDVATPSR
ncbi:GerMN domain-containing protein [Nonomuraea sp. WAC 01424]|uniref:GerMN domain-containing protein n=1 Tax=Nonomuraea sp. WAC 01424 TaxID=2203200 RepID=UPI001C8B9370|nr:GerMN domain-containing protein [Nonomuraea sp. WAC 01424]